MICDPFTGPVVITTIANDELDLVARGKLLFDLLDVVSFHSARRCLDVHDLLDHRVDPPQIHGATGLQKHLEAVVAEFGEQGKHGLLQERLSARDFDQRASGVFRALETIIDRRSEALVERVFRVAVGTPQVAACEADEKARSSRVARLALYAQEELVDEELSGGEIAHFRRQYLGARQRKLGGVLQ